MSFISVTVGVKTNRNIFLTLFKNQSPRTSLLKNKLTSKILTSRSMSSESKCIFCKIVNKTAEANILHEVNKLYQLISEIIYASLLFFQDEKLLVFTDRSPAAEHHYLVIPKVSLRTILHLAKCKTRVIIRYTLSTSGPSVVRTFLL